MGIEAVVCAALASAYASSQASSAASKQQALGTTYEDPILAKRREAPPEAIESAKCPCCGSRQFKVHASRRICTYCRSEQDGEVATPVTDQYLANRSMIMSERLAMMYGHQVLRPNAVVRVASLDDLRYP